MMLLMPLDMDRSLLEAALIGLEAHRTRVEEMISDVRSQLGERPPSLAGAAPTAAPARALKKRRLSAAGRRAIAEAARKRWAQVRAMKKASAAPAVKPAPAAKKRIAAKKAAPASKTAAVKKARARKSVKKVRPVKAAAAPPASEAS